MNVKNKRKRGFANSSRKTGTAYSKYNRERLRRLSYYVIRRSSKRRPFKYCRIDLKLPLRITLSVRKSRVTLNA